MFNEDDYRYISNNAFDDKFPGYRPNIIEAPNGDGYWDGDKRYAHIALKYLTDERGHLGWSGLHSYLVEANDKATEVAIKLGIPKEFWPSSSYGALRILEYPPGAITHPHTDFDLFTLMMYRNIPDDFLYCEFSQNNHLLNKANELNSQIHFGEILELINPSFKATRHEVIADGLNRTQYSIVYFAIPDHAAKLPSGETVGEWLDERLSRSRKEAS